MGRVKFGFSGLQMREARGPLRSINSGGAGAIFL